MSCCYYGNRGETNNLRLPTIIRISTGPIFGQSPPLPNGTNNCIANNPSERGSIIANANINKIQVENVTFNGLGNIPVNAVIFDPPICNSCGNSCNYCSPTCTTQISCCPSPSNDNSSCSNGNDIPPQQGCAKAFTLQVPPNCDSFMISVLAFQNFKYGKPCLPNLDNSSEFGKACNVNNVDLSAPTSYKAVYRFTWWVDVTQSCLVYPILALGPYTNFLFPVPSCTGTVTSTGECTSQCLQPFYNNNIIASNFYSTTNVTGNFPAGSNNIALPGNNTANAPIFPIFPSALTPGLGPIQYGTTTCAKFVYCSDKSTNTVTPSDLANLSNTCCVSCLTLFVPCCPQDPNIVLNN